MSLCCLGFSTQISPSSSRQPPLPKSVHFVNNFLRKLFTFVAPELSWPPLGSPNRCFPRCLVPSKEKCDDSYTLRSGILRLTPRRLKILRPPGLSWPPLGSPNRCFPRCLVPSKEKCDDSYTLRSGILRLTPRRLKILKPPGLSWPPLGSPNRCFP